MTKFVFAFLVSSWLIHTAVFAGELPNLKVLFVGSERSSDYVEFLEGKVAQVEVRSRSDFAVKDADKFDVILLDWPQGEETRNMRQRSAPLGARNEWTKPTVLLGSAGLNLAVAWHLKGGSGCTCMDPLAYDLREHVIFDRPFKIDRNKMISIPTPSAFRSEIAEEEIKILPLVEDLSRKWRAGWCTHARDFSAYPDVEFFCGGVNHQTPTSAGLWRQGNLLHFGFEQSPSEMNELGKQLLLNSIAYISDFTKDRPIAITPSIFGGPVARNRSTLARWLRNPQYPADFAKGLVAPEVWSHLSTLSDREAMAKWADENSRYLHPNSAQQLEVDEDLLAIGMAFDQPEFVPGTIADLRSTDPSVTARARRLLQRYVPCGPKDEDGTAWETWWKENQSFAFASDAGDYRWYIDPLAKSAGVPSLDFRGPKRSDQ